jgi:hypothetical protein
MRSVCPECLLQQHSCMAREAADSACAGFPGGIHNSGVRKRQLVSSRGQKHILDRRASNHEKSGLWVCEGIVQKHQGTMRFYSSIRLGQSGTVFSVFLPGVAAGVENSSTRPLRETVVRDAA